MQRELIQAWLRDDPDPATTAELSDLLARADAGDAAAQAELASAFAGRLEFGTAGLRGRLGPGPARMNRVLVGQAAAGLAQYLLDKGLADAPVIVGHDARHNSAIFAKDTAEILAGAGLRPLLCDRPLPTPVVAFGIKHFGCAAAVVVTASHNPPQDNGYKVYLGDGSQIVPPADAEIAARIDVAAARPLAEIPRSADYQVIGDELVAGYVQRAASLVSAGTPRELNWVYTAMHGVGGAIVDQVVAATGFGRPHQVAEQQQPDPDFPTVAFPNPEEPGTMDLSLALAAEVGADVIIASDPDADRCAAGIPTADGWRMLHGDELGVLLAWWVIQRRAAKGLTGGVLGQSMVSSSLLEAMAKDAGLGYGHALIGFKWICRVPGLVYGYEEALGYCVDPANVSDKDGISAGLLIAELVAALKAQGRTPQDVLDELALRHGVYLTDQVNLRVTDLSRIGAVMAAVRADQPTQVAGIAVTRLDDLTHGWAGLPPLDGLRFELASGGRVIIRPSGTEPKVKCYLQAVASVEDGDLAAARARARAELDAVIGAVRVWLG